MCFYKTKESKVLVAKRGIKVYKIGIYADDAFFTPFFYVAFKYPANKPVYEAVEFFSFAIELGLHSYVNCLLNSVFPHAIDLFTLGHLQYTISLLKYKVFLGEFIIPKGATYCLNRNGEVVSDVLVYTGKYIKLEPCKRYDSKELWKEN